MGTKFIQNNGHKSKAASAVLAEVLRSSTETVALIQEPYITHGKPRNLGNLNTNFPGPDARTLITATKDAVSYTHLTLPTIYSV